MQDKKSNEQLDFNQSKVNTPGPEIKPTGSALSIASISKKKRANAKEEIKTINPLDPGLNDPQVDLCNWHLALGNYSQGVIACSTPKLNDFEPDNLQYNIDISLNGQQFSGYPIIFRFYDIQITSIIPNNGMLDGGNILKIYGSGFYDSNSKKARVSSKFGDHMLELRYEKSDKSLRLQIPPVSWIVKGEHPTNEQIELLQKKELPTIEITLNGIEWTFVSKYLYMDPKYIGLKPEPDYGKDIPEEDANKQWNAPEPVPVFENADGKYAYKIKRSMKKSLNSSLKMENSPLKIRP